MTPMNLVEVIEAVRELTQEDWQKLRQWLSQTGTPQYGTATVEEKFHRQLLQEGIISEIPKPITDFSPYLNRKPLQIQGSALSETIIEDRR